MSWETEFSSIVSILEENWLVEQVSDLFHQCSRVGVSGSVREVYPFMSESNHPLDVTGFNQRVAGAGRAAMEWDIIEVLLADGVAGSEQRARQIMGMLRKRYGMTLYELHLSMVEGR